MTTVTIVEKLIGDQKLVLETGKVARQAHGAVSVRYGDTTVLATALTSPPTRDIDFFPLYVDYREMQYAGGKFPGGFFKREGRPTAKEILSCRMIDRTVRPLFAEDFTDEVQIQCIVVSADKDYDADVLAVIGGSAALALSPAPFLGPVGAVRVGRVDGQLVIFPTYEQRERSDFDLVVAGRSDSINMIELGGREVPEEFIVEGCRFAHEYVKTIVAMIEELAAKAGQQVAYEAHPLSEELRALVEQRCAERIAQAKRITGKAERNEALAAICDELVAELCPEGEEQPQYPEADVRKAFYKVEGRIQRELILAGHRPDGRGLRQVRPITIEVPALPRVHGSALFTRGETQSLATVTLGTPRDQQKIDGLPEEYYKRFLLHYNFPPFSVGEIRPIRGPGRRDIGHGALAEKSIEAVLPPADDFPYTVRVVSEILESNGSSSMASVCSASLALMDAGVPISAPVAGISIGMVREDAGKVLLTDIIGEEDFHGDMDFKVAGTRKGVTGIQLDVKPVVGLDVETIAEALAQAREARLEVLEEMARAIPAPRPEISPYAPKMVTLTIDIEKIGKLIGPGGKTINGLSAKYDVTIDVEDDGKVYVAGTDGEGVKQAVAEIEAMTQEAKLGQIYTGRVVSIRDFGAFVEIFPGQDGLCHVSELDEKFVKNVSDVVKVGDTVTVKVIAIDEQGRVKLSRKAAMREQRGRADRS
ncbi:MAG: polyribonucleotide nucleotidyltransferase [Planctomycetales bacterium 4484_123]|nr:MAG: polyribonucleotide nucleotidyltransferase [Planctomycetales bacterium 4484_123]